MLLRISNKLIKQPELNTGPNERANLKETKRRRRRKKDK
jgi:hypothetical protein